MTDAVLLSMLDRTGVLRHRTQTGPPGRAGDATWQWTETDLENVYVEQTAAEEVVTGETTALSSHLGVLPSGTVIDASDELIVDGVTYEVLGHPARVWEPSAGESHVEVKLKVAG